MVTTWINTDNSINVFCNPFILLFKRKLDKTIIKNLC